MAFVVPALAGGLQFRLKAVLPTAQEIDAKSFCASGLYLYNFKRFNAGFDHELHALKV